MIIEGQLICFLCKKSDGKIILFSEGTLKKFQTILKARKIHNLKYNSVTLPNEYTDGGYNRECHKIFTGLQSQYYSLEPIILKIKKVSSIKQLV